MRIAVVGAKGQLGAALVHECSPGHEVVAFSQGSSSTSATRPPSPLRSRRVKPEVILNCGGLQRRRCRRGSTDRGAERQRVRRARRSPALRCAHDAHAGSLQHRLRVRRQGDDAVHARPTRRTR